MTPLLGPSDIDQLPALQRLLSGTRGRFCLGQSAVPAGPQGGGGGSQARAAPGGLLGLSPATAAARWLGERGREAKAAEPALRRLLVEQANGSQAGQARPDAGPGSRRGTGPARGHERSPAFGDLLWPSARGEPPGVGRDGPESAFLVPGGTPMWEDRKTTPLARRSVRSIPSWRPTTTRVGRPGQGAYGSWPAWGASAACGRRAARRRGQQGTCARPCNDLTRSATLSSPHTPPDTLAVPGPEGLAACPPRYFCSLAIPTTTSPAPPPARLRRTPPDAHGEALGSLARLAPAPGHPGWRWCTTLLAMTACGPTLPCGRLAGSPVCALLPSCLASADGRHCPRPPNASSGSIADLDSDDSQILPLSAPAPVGRGRRGGRT